jgi:hypothetical protein
MDFFLETCFDKVNGIMQFVAADRRDMFLNAVLIAAAYCIACNGQPSISFAM